MPVAIFFLGVALGLQIMSGVLTYYKAECEEEYNTSCSIGAAPKDWEDHYESD